MTVDSVGNDQVACIGCTDGRIDQADLRKIARNLFPRSPVPDGFHTTFVIVEIETHHCSIGYLSCPKESYLVQRNLILSKRILSCPKGSSFFKKDQFPVLNVPQRKGHGQPAT